MCYVTSGGSADRFPSDGHIVALISGSSVHIDRTELNIKEGGSFHPSGKDATSVNHVRNGICGIMWGSRASTQIPQHILHKITDGLSHRSFGALVTAPVGNSPARSNPTL